MFDGMSLFWGAWLLPARGGVLFSPANRLGVQCTSLRLPFHMEMMSRLQRKPVFFPSLWVCTEMQNPAVCHVSKLFFKCGIGGSASETFVETHQVWVTEINETWHPRWVHLKCKLYEWIYCGTLHYAVFKWPLSICFSASRSSRSHSPPRRREVCTARFLIVQNAARVWPLFFFLFFSKNGNKVKYVQWSFQTHLKVISFSTCRCILSPCPLCRLQKVGSSLCQSGGLSN